MRPFACALVLVAACSKPGGIELDVTAISTVTEVRVYIGTGGIPAYPGAIAVPPRTGSAAELLQTANVFTRDPDNGSDWLPYTPGETLHFEFESSGRETLGAIIVVGFDADHQPVASWIQTNLVLSPHEIDRFAIDLSGADTSSQVFLWGPAGSDVLPDGAPCAGVATPSADARTGFIVTAGDTDCDGYANDDTALECDPYYYDDATGASLAAGTSVMFVPDTTECELFGATCVDGTGPGAGFSPTSSCLPAPVCRGDCIDTSDALACLIEPSPSVNDTDTGYMCKIGTDTSSGNCAALVLPRPPTGGYACDGTASGILGSDGTLAHDQVIDGVDFTFDVDDACTLTLTPNSSGGPAGSGARVLVEVALQNGTNLVMPVDVQTENTACATAATAGASCVVTQTNLQDPVLTKCVAGWSTPVPVVDHSGQPISGTAPALDGAMTHLFYISNHNIFVVSRASTSDSWGSATELSVTLDGIDGATFSSLHLSRDGSDLWIGAEDTSGNGTTIVGGGVWHVSVIYPLTGTMTLLGTPVQPADAIAFSPAASVDGDVAIGTAGFELDEIDSGTPDGAGIAMGETPFFSDDAESLWFSAPQGGYIAVATPTGIEDIEGPPGSDVPDGGIMFDAMTDGSGSSGSGSGLEPDGAYWIYVVSRADATTPFPDFIDPEQSPNAVGPVELSELGSASYPEGPWLSPDLHTLYFSSDTISSTADTPFLYMSTR